MRFAGVGLIKQQQAPRPWFKYVLVDDTATQSLSADCLCVSPQQQMRSGAIQTCNQACCHCTVVSATSSVFGGVVWLTFNAGKAGSLRRFCSHHCCTILLALIVAASKDQSWLQAVHCKVHYVWAGMCAAHCGYFLWVTLRG